MESLIAYADQPKFWITQFFYDLLVSMGLKSDISNTIVFILSVVLLVVIILAVNVVVRYVSAKLIPKNRKNAQLNIYDILVEKRFFNRLLVLVALIVVFQSSTMLFTGFSESWQYAELMISRAVIVAWVTLVIYSMLNSWEKYVALHPKTKHKSLKGYIQLVKIGMGIVAGIIIVSIVSGISKSELLMGFGATAAIITLVFKDTILGFVASIQLSFQDMLRPGDWIEMPSKGADGRIVDVNLNSVKVQNWDKSVTMLPIYSLVTDSFTNWRRMENGSGRLFQRTFLVDIDSVKTIDREYLDRLSNHEATQELFDEALQLCKQSSPHIISNLALYRAYLETYLRHHPSINEKQWLFVRYCPDVTENGIGVEIFAFSRKTPIAGYDEVHRMVMEYVFVTAPLFGVVLFQNAAGKDFRVTPA